jgi:tetratricopeptide (TPR) repeat protein
MVANPHSFSAQDSAASVRIGAGLRDKVEKVSDRWFKMILRLQMNEALQQYAYPIDAVLPPLVARQLASSLQARALVAGTILRGEGGRYTIEARLAGMNDDAGHIVRVSQLPNQAFEDFGARVGDSLASSFKALPDARACENLRGTAAAKATEAATKALRAQPTNGLAHYCLAQIAIAEKAPVETIIEHLKATTTGDRLSLKAWNALAVHYQAKGDSSATVDTYKEMLKVAPTNEPLRKEAYKLFLSYGKLDAAEEVADSGLALDPANADLWDLKSSACLFQDIPVKNKCAVDALEQVYALDSTKADTTFFTKITFAASRPSTVETIKVKVDSAGTTKDSLVTVPDTARFVKWARMGEAKYPGSAILIGQLAEAYSVSGQIDSSVAVTKRLMRVDSSDVSPVLRVAKALVDAKRGKEALELSPYIERLGSTDDKANMSGLLALAAFHLLQKVPPDYPTAAELARAAIRMASGVPGRIAFANYVLGFATFLQVPPLDIQAAEQKSCELAKQARALLDEAGPALQAGRSINEAAAARYIQGVESYGPRNASLQKAYCK